MNYKMRYKVEIYSSVGETTTWTDNVSVVSGITSVYAEMIGDYEDGYLNIVVFDSLGVEVGWINSSYTFSESLYAVCSSDGSSEEYRRLYPFQDWMTYKIQSFMHE